MLTARGAKQIMSRAKQSASFVRTNLLWGCVNAPANVFVLCVYQLSMTNEKEKKEKEKEKKESGPCFLSVRACVTPFFRK